MIYLVEENPMKTPPTRMPMPKHYCMLFDSIHKQQFPTFFLHLLLQKFWLLVLNVPARGMENCVKKVGRGEGGEGK